MKSLRTIYLAIVAYLLCFLQCYYSMQSFAKELSAYCLDCMFYSEILITSLLTALTFPIVQLLKAIRLNTQLKNVIGTVSFFLLMYMVNANIFDSRVASWSSYSHTDVLISVFFLSYPYLLVSILSFWVALKKLKLFQSDNNNS